MRPQYVLLLCLALARQHAVQARAELLKQLSPELVLHLIDGLRKAGLEIAPANATATPAATMRP
jgi:hypothetical protein